MGTCVPSVHYLHISASHNRSNTTSLGSIHCSLQPGALPHSNPMSLFPADVFPTGNEPEIPEALRPALRAHRAYVQQCLIAVRLRRAIPMPRGLIRRPATAAPAAGAALAPIPTGRALLSRLDSMSTPTVRRVCENCSLCQGSLNLNIQNVLVRYVCVCLCSRFNER